MDWQITMSMDPWQIMLVRAHNAHAQRTGHTEYFIGMNFIDCLQCSRHGHINSAGMMVIHDAGYAMCEIQRPEDF